MSTEDTSAAPAWSDSAILFSASQPLPPPPLPSSLDSTTTEPKPLLPSLSLPSFPNSDLDPSRPIHTPPSSNPSPPKRARVVGPSPPSLRPLPLPLLLLTLATILHRASLALQPSLAKRPSSSSSAQYTANLIAYERYEAGAVALLRAVINGTGGVEIGGGRVELRARIMLVELLARTEGKVESGEGEGEKRRWVESERVVAKGIAAAQQHPDYTPYALLLYALQAHLASSTNPKFAKSTLKRALSESTAHPSWTYHFLLALSSLSADEKDYPGALSPLREVEKIAARRGDVEMGWAVKVLIARLALGAGEMKVAGEAVKEVGDWMGFGGEEVERSAQMGCQLRIQFVLVFCLYHAQMGNVKLAKETLRKAHQLLDEKDPEEGADEGWTKIPIRAADSTKSSRTGSLSSSPTQPIFGSFPTPTSVTLALSPRALVYSFAFLVSVAVHRDPFGNKPRSLLFADEGLRTLDAKLRSTEPLTSLPPSQILATLAIVAKMKVHLLLFSSELAIMRSALPSADTHLSNAIAVCRSYAGLWETFRGRITLDKGLLAQYRRGQDELAMRCFETVLVVAGNEDEALLAKVSILLLQISMGARVRISEEGSTSGKKRKSVGGTADAETRLNDLAKEVVEAAGEEGASPGVVLLGELVQALTRGEIIKAKQHLSMALNLSNNALANHAKALMLALLANLFLHTRNDQAQKMLHASFHIASGMGARPDPQAKKQISVVANGEKTSSTAPPNVVGNARLGLWLGTRLLESYKAGAAETYRGQDAKEAKLHAGKVKELGNKARMQEGVNEAHRRVLAMEVGGR